jgi:hypothetical protein
MSRLLIATIAWAYLGCGSVFAQVAMGTATPPLGITSPLGIGPGAPVAPTGIPLGGFELSSPGVSPATAGASSMGLTAGQTACIGIGGSIPEASFGAASSTAATSVGTATSTSGTSASTTLFDGGGTAGTASGTCATGSTAASNPAASASSPNVAARSTVGRVGIPLGATELGAGGLSPPPDVPITIPSPSSSVSCCSLLMSTSAVSTGASTVPCPTTGVSSTTGTSTSSGGSGVSSTTGTSTSSGGC